MTFLNTEQKGQSLARSAGTVNSNTIGLDFSAIKTLYNEKKSGGKKKLC